MKRRYQIFHLFVTFIKKRIQQFNEGCSRKKNMWVFDGIFCLSPYAAFLFLLAYAFYALNVPGVNLMFEYTLLIYITNVNFMLLLCTGKL